MKVISPNLFFMFSKRLDFTALNPFCFRSFMDSEFMSTGIMFFLLMNFEAVSASIPEPVPMSSIFIEDKNVGVGLWVLGLGVLKYFFRKSAKKYESLAG